jgi:lipid-A-disaccharide synthase
MADRKRYRIAIVAGEVSGDLLAAGLIRELSKYSADFEFFGVAGDAMRREGCRTLYDIGKLTLMGLDGLFGRIREILNIRRDLVEQLKKDPPDLFIGVDAPDFNLGLEKRLRKIGIPVLHYVSPTVWAWRKYRLRSMRHSIDRILVLFPFELSFYRERGMDAVLVGHPMVRDIEVDPDISKLRRKFSLGKDKRVVALLPGSRRSEIGHMAMDFLEAARLLSESYADLQFITAMPDAKLMAAFEAELQASSVDTRISLVRVVGHSREVMACSDVIMLASGTAALEAAIIGRPSVVAYKVSWLTKTMVQLLSSVSYFSMPNNLAGYRLVPELMQDDCTPENLAAEVARFLDDRKEVDRVIEGFKKIRNELDMDSDYLAAKSAAEMLGLSEQSGSSA